MAKKQGAPVASSKEPLAALPMFQLRGLSGQSPRILQTTATMVLVLLDRHCQRSSGGDPRGRWWSFSGGIMKALGRGAPHSILNGKAASTYWNSKAARVSRASRNRSLARIRERPGHLLGAPNEPRSASRNRRGQARFETHSVSCCHPSGVGENLVMAIIGERKC